MIQTSKTVMQRFFTERFFDQAAQTAYYFLLSFIPFIIFLFSLLKFFPIDTNNLLLLIRPFVPSSAFELIERSINTVINQSGKKILSFSLLATFWLASMAVQSLVRSLNDAHQIKRKQRFLHALINDLILTFGFMIIVSLSLFVPIIEEVFRHFILTKVDIPEFWYTSWTFVRWWIGTSFLFLFFVFFYKMVPSAKITWKKALPGTVFTTLGWQVASTGFSYYVQSGKYSQIYGQLGSIIILMIWFYLTAAILLIGGLINGQHYRNTHKTKAT
ncbi:YihY/virulence factor BrkB family protein [Priestia megaterium]|nr:YihY/virulence factor BrkB family protein [Priestia megaterium]